MMIGVNTRVSYSINDILYNLVASDKIDMGNEVTRFRIFCVSCNMSKYGLTDFVQPLNNRRIPSKASV